MGRSWLGGVRGGFLVLQRIVQFERLIRPIALCSEKPVVAMRELPELVQREVQEKIRSFLHLGVSDCGSRFLLANLPDQELYRTPILPSAWKLGREHFQGLGVCLTVPALDPFLCALCHPGICQQRERAVHQHLWRLLASEKVPEQWTNVIRTFLSLKLSKKEECSANLLPNPISAVTVTRLETADIELFLLKSGGQRLQVSVEIRRLEMK